MCVYKIIQQSDRSRREARKRVWSTGCTIAKRRRWEREWVVRERTWDARTSMLPLLRGIVSVCVRGSGRYPDTGASRAFYYHQRRRPSSWRGLSRHEVWECLRLYLDVLSFCLSFSLPRHEIRMYTIFILFFPSHSRVSHSRIFFCLHRDASLISPALPASFLRSGLHGCDGGCSHQCRHTTARACR